MDLGRDEQGNLQPRDRRKGMQGRQVAKEVNAAAENVGGHLRAPFPFVVVRL